jgi:hypothetical protein
VNAPCQLIRGNFLPAISFLPKIAAKEAHESRILSSRLE